jgi:hypothetical protein
VDAWNNSLLSWLDTQELTISDQWTCNTIVYWIAIFCPHKQSLWLLSSGKSPAKKEEMPCYCAQNHTLKFNNDGNITTVAMSCTIISYAFNVAQLGKRAGIDLVNFCLLRRKTKYWLLWQMILLTTLVGDISCSCVPAEKNGPPVPWTLCPNTVAVTWTLVSNNAGWAFVKQIHQTDRILSLELGLAKQGTSNTNFCKISYTTSAMNISIKKIIEIVLAIVRSLTFLLLWYFSSSVLGNVQLKPMFASHHVQPIAQFLISSNLNLY